MCGVDFILYRLLRPAIEQRDFKARRFRERNERAAHMSRPAHDELRLLRANLYINADFPAAKHAVRLVFFRDIVLEICVLALFHACKRIQYGAAFRLPSANRAGYAPIRINEHFA